MPLITVELGYDGHFDLGPDDADMFLAVPGSAVIWQKAYAEPGAGLAAGVKSLPGLTAISCSPMQTGPGAHGRRWSRTSWCSCSAMSTHLNRGWSAGVPPHSCLSTQPRVLIRRKLCAAGKRVPVHPSPRQRPGTYNCGMAWAARRELLDRCRFFDASIIGGGDRNGRRRLRLLTMGRLAQLNARQLDYLRWAQPFTTPAGVASGQSTWISITSGMATRPIAASAPGTRNWPGTASTPSRTSQSIPGAAGAGTATNRRCTTT